MNGGDLLPPPSKRTGANLKMWTRNRAVCDPKPHSFITCPPAGTEKVRRHRPLAATTTQFTRKHEAKHADLVEAVRKCFRKLKVFNSPLLRRNSLDAMQYAVMVAIVTLPVKVAYLRMQSKACVKTCGAMPCSCCRIRHCSRVTDMAVRSLALLQLVKRTPFSRRQI